MNEEEMLREVMRTIGRRKTERKAKSSAENLAVARATPEYKAKLSAAQQARREREKAAQGA